MLTGGSRKFEQTNSWDLGPMNDTLLLYFCRPGLVVRTLLRCWRWAWLENKSPHLDDQSPPPYRLGNFWVGYSGQRNFFWRFSFLHFYAFSMLSHPEWIGICAAPRQNVTAKIWSGVFSFDGLVPCYPPTIVRLMGVST